jgi:hypothetical protein
MCRTRESEEVADTGPCNRRFPRTDFPQDQAEWRRLEEEEEKKKKKLNIYVFFF